MTTGIMAGIEPTIETGRRMLLAGFRQTHRSKEADREIPRQWRRLWPYFGSLAHQVDNVAYGLRFTRADDQDTDYMCAIEVHDFDGLPPELDTMRLPRRAYAVFRDASGMSGLRRAWRGVWQDWYPQSGVDVLEPPDFERYGEAFDPGTGEGVIELWIPLGPDEKPAPNETGI